MIVFKEKLYSIQDSIRIVNENGNMSCIELIKCMEFYDSCPNDIPHWVNVATSKFDKISKYPDFSGGLLFLPALDRDFIADEYGKDYQKYQKKFNPSECIKEFKKYIETVKDEGKPKYYGLLSKDLRGNVIWKHSEKYYLTFFKYLVYLLDFRISSSELSDFGISEDGKVWGKPSILDSKKSISIHKNDFKNLIFEYIYYLNYGCFDRNTELVKRIQGKL